MRNTTSTFASGKIATTTPISKTGCWTRSPTAYVARQGTIVIAARAGDWARDARRLFRDVLRAHPDIATAYAALKRELAARYGEDRTGYTDAKTGFIEDALARHAT